MQELQGEPCKVCGCTDLNLIDGFYYCVECGTQDVNVRQTIVEELHLPESSYNIKAVRTTKIKNIVQERDTVSPEWHKWHCYNYILAGLVDEMISLGANPSFKSKVLWLWTMYVKKYQRRKELGLTEGDDADSAEYLPKSNNKSVQKAFVIEDMTNTLFFTILYLALNYDKSDIQLSHLVRFVLERRLSYRDFSKFLPKDIDVYLVDGFSKLCCCVHPGHMNVQTYAASIIKTFNLRPPVLPDLKKIADRFVTELCLPCDFKNLVYSLMQLVPCDYLILDETVMKTMPNIPFYECVVMSYIVVGLKMCFGLDDDYEIKLSDAVDQINIESCHMKCYKLGVFTLSSDRLFSFREWLCFLRLRKVVLSKFYWPMAQISNMDVDDFVYMEQREPPSESKCQFKRSKPTILTDEITMNILSKIDENFKVDVIPRSAFPLTLTPLTTYTDVILDYYKDPELRLLLSEDFTQYSLKYACETLNLRVSDNTENIVVGVDKSSKYVNPMIQVPRIDIQYDWSMTYVRNCENKNWLNTRPPTPHCIEKVEHNNDKENDGSFSSKNNSLEVASESSKDDDSSVKNDVDIKDNSDFLQEDESVNIFDDDFQNLKEYEEIKHNVNIKTEPIDKDILETNHDIDNNDVDTDEFFSRVGNLDQNNDNNLSGLDNNIGYFFNPENFNREETIRELVLLTCKKYRIPIPPEFKIKERKKTITTRETQTSEPKPKKAKFSSAKMQATCNASIYDLLSAYHENLCHDEFSNKITNDVRVVGDTQNYIDITEHKADDEENYSNNTVFDQHPNDGFVVDGDHSVQLVENEAVQSHQEDDSNLNTQADLFDENIYDIKQLYLKVQETCNEDVFDISNDLEIDQLLSKKINECNTVKSKNIDATKILKEVYDDDSDDNIPLSAIKAEKCRFLRKLRNFKESNQLEYLIKNRKDIQNFNYWTRHPPYLLQTEKHKMVSNFNIDLNENFPKSFAFLIQECADILNCNTKYLYHYAMIVEEKLLSKFKTDVS